MEYSSEYMTDFDIIGLSNQGYQAHLEEQTRRNQQEILLFLVPERKMKCTHRLVTPSLPSTPCPPSSPGFTINKYHISGPHAFQPIGNLPTGILREDYINPQDTISKLNDLSGFLAMESISSSHGSRVNHIYYICRLCTPQPCSTLQ